jgi:transient receptor potential cation channel subfamily A protein 1
MNEINKSQTRFIPLTPAEPPTENDKKNDLETISIKDDTPLLSDKDNNLYSGPLTKKILDQGSAEKLFSLLKQSKQEEFVAYFDTLSLTYQNDLINLDDGTSTMLQYACEKGLSKVVRYLLDRDVNIHLTVRKNEKRPIELVAEHGYYEIFQMLLDHPNIKILISTFCYIIKHSDETKYEKCCKMLLKKRESNEDIVDVNGEDTIKNTLLHYSLHYASEEISLKLLKLGASLASKNDFGIMPIEYIKPELLEKHLDECVEFNIKNKNDEKPDFEVTLNYKSLIPARKMKNNKCDEFDPESCVYYDNIVLETEVITYMNQTPEFKALLKHPVIVSFLLMKWHKIQLLFYTFIVFYVLFILSLFIYIYTYYFDRQTPSDFCLALGKLSCFVVSLTFWILVLIDFFQITVSPKKYFKNCENCLELILVVTTGMILYISSPTNDTKNKLGSMAYISAALLLVFKVGQHSKFSTYLLMFKTVIVNFLKLLVFFLPLITAFALVSNIFFVNTKLPKSTNGTDVDAHDEDNLFMGAISLFNRLLTSKFDAGSINSELVFSTFIMITTSLLNLLNGLPVSDAQTIKNNPELEEHINNAQHIYFVESTLFGNILSSSAMKSLQHSFSCFPCVGNMSYTFLKILARKVCHFTNTGNYRLTVLPNNHGKIYYESSFPTTSTKPCSDTYLDKQTVRRINSIIKSRRGLKKGRHSNCEEIKNM